MGQPPKETKEVVVKEENPKIDETTSTITSIVFIRDASLLDDNNEIDQREAFQHHNYLDVRSLVKKREFLADEASSPTARAALRMKPKITQQDFAYKLQGAEDVTLLFESRFESGNLFLAQKVSDSNYNLLMQNDINTDGHTQWFYFRVLNTRAGHTVKFNILNFSKLDSLFNFGMKVSVYSERHAQEHQQSWAKTGKDIKYYSNGIKKDLESPWSKTYYTLTFTHTFQYDNDSVLFAYSVPYTYSDLRKDLHAIEADEKRSVNVARKVLCKTLAGEDCEVLTITSRDNLETFNKR